MLELSDKNFKVVIIKMLQEALENMLETNEKNSLNKDTGSFSK